MIASAPDRYHPMQVGFHWLVVILLFAMFILGKVMSGMPNDSTKLVPLGLHIILGFTTFVVIVLRFVARLRLPQPAAAHTGSRFLDLLGIAVHYALYGLVLLMVISGTSLSMRAGIIPIVFGASSAPLPANFFVYSARSLHGISAQILFGTVILHVGAAFYHQLLLKDHIFKRMSFASKSAGTPLGKAAQD